MSEQTLSVPQQVFDGPWNGSSCGEEAAHNFPFCRVIFPFNCSSIKSPSCSDCSRAHLTHLICCNISKQKASTPIKLSKVITRIKLAFTSLLTCDQASILNSYNTFCSLTAFLEARLKQSLRRLSVMRIDRACALEVLGSIRAPVCYSYSRCRSKQGAFE